MEKLREVKKRKLIASLILLTFVIIVVKMLLFPFKNPAPTPQQLMLRLQLAVESGDERQITTLFSSSEALRKFRNVPTGRYTPTVEPLAISRKPSESSLYAWNSWFDRNGQSNLIFRQGEDGVFHCVDTSGSFGLSFEHNSSGYLISGCDFSI